ncbi:MAG TPA: hypothetical protein VGU68_14465 [Ktedonobacteraceae bacterium]|nr:hypothetical protein [Ktedonobacteraceae bacterium]
MHQITWRRTSVHIGLLQIGIVVLAVITALIHLELVIKMGMFTGAHAGAHHAEGGFALLRYIPLSLSMLFLLNCIGYIVLVVALYLPVLRRLQRPLRWLLIVYTAVTIIAWFVITGGGPNLLAYVDKPIEVALIALLLIEDWQATHLAKGRAS